MKNEELKIKSFETWTPGFLKLGHLVSNWKLSVQVSKNWASKSRRFGFTLIEIIVSISIFTVVMLVTMGALLTLNDSSRKAQALRTVIDNLNFAVEDMNRKIRTGDSYHCYRDGEIVSRLIETNPKDCSGTAGYAISLKTQELDPISNNPIWIAYVFKKDPDTGIGGIKIRRSIEPVGIEAIIESQDEGSFITSPEVNIQRMEFRVVGAQNEKGPGIKTQPMIIINISGLVDLNKEKLRTNFSLQTAISKRGTEVE